MAGGGISDEAATIATSAVVVQTSWLLTWNLLTGCLNFSGRRVAFGNPA
jgi:hypothetical protein